MTKVSKYSIVQAFEVPEYTDLIMALFWIYSRVYIKKEDNGYELKGKILIQWWTDLLDIDTSECKKYSKYLAYGICNNPHLSKEEKIGIRTAYNLSNTIGTLARKKLRSILRDLIKENSLSLYGIKFTNNKQIDFKPKKIPTKDVIFNNIDIEKETLLCGNSTYENLCVLTDNLFQIFPNKHPTLSTKSLQNIVHTTVIETKKITKRNNGGRPKEKETQLAEKYLRQYVKKNGGLKWYKVKYEARILDSRDFLKKTYDIKVSRSIINTILNKIKIELQPTEN